MLGESSTSGGLKTPTRIGFLPPTPPSSSTFSPEGNSSWTYDKALDLASPIRSEETPERVLRMTGDSGKRGRPRADVISSLILEGSSSPSGIKCRVCSRVFPREKSLQAHLRTHTGERPYNCDYPGCNRAFTQSGQLKTHQRLHAGEKPFICSSPGCNNRYTHANRTCPAHPYHKPQRSSDLVLQPVLSGSENSDAVMMWLDNYRRDRQEKTPGKTLSVEAPSSKILPHPSANTPAKEEVARVLKRGLELDIENSPRGLSSINTSKKSCSILEERLASPRKTLGDITLLNAVNSPVSSKFDSSVGSFKLKKRWLKEAFLDQERKKPYTTAVMVETNEDLALPIRWTSEDEQQRRSPKSMVVAKALVELSSFTADVNDSQPLNLSLSSDSSSVV